MSVCAINHALTPFPYPVAVEKHGFRALILIFDTGSDHPYRQKKQEKKHQKKMHAWAT